MTKYSAFVIILALRIFYHPSEMTNSQSPFSSPVTHSVAPNYIPAKLLSIQGSLDKNKVVINWTVGENETADQFEVERSTDGKNFRLAGLVFSEDKPQTVNYQFFEKATRKKIQYRVKLINKNKETEYSGIVEINPAA